MLLNFNGQGNGVQLGTTEALGMTNASFSIEMWFYLEESDNKGNFLLRSESKHFSIYLLPKFIVFQHHGLSTAKSNFAYPSGSWLHLALVYDLGENSCSCYINGELLFEFATGPNNHNEMLFLGIDPVTKKDHFSGSITEVRFWGKALSREEIAQRRFKRLSGTEEQLTAYFPLNEGRGNIALNHALPSVSADLAMVRAEGINWQDYFHATDGPLAINFKLENQMVASFPGPGNEIIPRITQSDLLSKGASFNHAMGLEMWIQPRPSSQEYVTIFHLTDVNHSVGFWLDISPNGSLLLVFADQSFSGSIAKTALSQSLEVSTWSHLAVSMIDGFIFVFVNGKQIAQEPWPTQEFFSHKWNEWTLGGFERDDKTSFLGEISEFRFWNDSALGLVDDFEHISTRLNTAVHKSIITYLPLDDDQNEIPQVESRPSIHYANIIQPIWSEEITLPNILDPIASNIAVFQNAHINLADHELLQIQGEITLESWVKLSSDLTQHGSETEGAITTPIISRIDRMGTEQAGWELRVGRGGAAFNLHFADGQQSLHSKNPLQLDCWYHVAGVYDGQQQSLYINGVLVASQAISGTILLAQSPAQIGYQASGSEGFSFHGLLAEVRIWNTARRAVDILSTMHLPITDPSSDNLIGVWRLDQDEYSIADVTLEMIRKGLPSLPLDVRNISNNYIEGTGIGLVADLDHLPIANRVNSLSHRRARVNIQQDNNAYILFLLDLISQLPINEQENFFEQFQKIVEQLKNLDNSGGTSERLAALLEERNIFEASLLALQDDLVRLRTESTSKINELQGKISAFESQRAGNAVSITQFIDNLQNTLKATQETLARNQQGYQLQNVNMDIKALMVDGGTGIKFPNDFKETNSDELTTFKMTFAPGNAFQQLNAANISVPDMSGLTEALARRKLTALGLTTKVNSQAVPPVSEFSKNNIGRVVNQIPKQGEAVAAGTIITLFIGKAS